MCTISGCIGPHSGGLSAVFSTYKVSVLRKPLLSEANGLVEPGPDFFVLFVLVILVFSFVTFGTISTSSVPSAIYSVKRVPIPCLFFVLSIAIPGRCFVPCFSDVNVTLQLGASPCAFLVLDDTGDETTTFPVVLSTTRGHSGSFFSLDDFGEKSDPLPFSSVGSLPSCDADRTPFLEHSFTFSVLFVRFIWPLGTMCGGQGRHPLWGGAQRAQDST